MNGGACEVDSYLNNREGWRDIFIGTRHFPQSTSLQDRLFFMYVSPTADSLCSFQVTTLLVTLRQGSISLAGPSGHAYLGSCFEMFLVRTAMLEILRPD